MMHHLWFSNVKCEKAEGGKVILKQRDFHCIPIWAQVQILLRELGKIKNVSMGFVSGTAARRCECKPSCRTVPTPWLDRMRKAGAVPASQICQQGSLPEEKELADSS